MIYSMTWQVVCMSRKHVAWAESIGMTNKSAHAPREIIITCHIVCAVCVCVCMHVCVCAIAVCTITISLSIIDHSHDNGLHQTKPDRSRQKWL